MDANVRKLLFLLFLYMGYLATFRKRTNPILFGILLLMPFFNACNTSNENKNLYHGILYSEDSELYYGVVFPDYNDTVVEEIVSNPIYPDAKITNWSLMRLEDNRYYHYFLAVNELSDSLKSSIASFEGGLDYLMRVVVKAGISKNNGVDPRIIEFEHDYLAGLEVTADVDSSFFSEGNVTIQCFSDGNYIVAAGVVTSDPDDSDARAFMESFVVE